MVKNFEDILRSCLKLNCIDLCTLVVVVIQFFIWCFPFSRDGRIYPIPSAISRTPSLHLSRLRASSFFKPTFSVSSSTCFFQVFFGRPRFLLPVTSRFRATLKTLSSSLLSTCPYHLLHLLLLTGLSFPSTLKYPSVERNYCSRFIQILFLF